MNKKLLACALASTLALQVFAGAFSDVSDETSKEIIGELSALNVINGYEDGTFKPENPVTRAEFSKMMYVLMNKGVDDGANSYKEIDVFADSEGHWAEGYINFCYQKGLINGKSATEFAPNSHITNLEAAKIALGYIGYNAEVEGFVGADWQVNTAAKAIENDLFEYNGSATTSETATRQNAANILYSAANATRVSYVQNVLTESTETGFDADFNLSSIDGILVATGEYGINGATPKEGTVTIFNTALNKHMTYTSDKNMTELLGANVNLLFDVDTDEAYGAYVANGKVLETTFDSVILDDGEIEIDGRSYEVGQDANAYIGEKSYPFENVFTDARASSEYVRFVISDDNVVLYAFLNETYYGEVLAVYDDRITTSINGLQTISKDDIASTTEVSASDFITIYKDPYSEKYMIETLDLISGEAVAGRDGEIKIGDTWYALHYKAVEGTKLPSLGSTSTIYVAGNYVIASAEDVVLGEDFAVVINISSIKDFNGNYRARLLLENGSELAIDIDKSLPVGSFISYIEGDEVYNVELISSENLVGFENYLSETAMFTHETDKLGSSFITDDAIIFVDANNDYSVLTGAEFKMIGADFGESFVALTTKDTGFDYVHVAYVVSTTAIPAISGTTEFGFVYDDPYMTLEDDEKVVKYPIFNVTEMEITEVSETTDVRVYDFITYIKLEDGTYVGVQSVDTTKGAITAYDKASGTFKVSNDDTEYTITDDTKIIFVDYDENTGAETAEITLADKDNAGNYINNIEFKVNGSEVELLVVSKNNIVK